MRLFFTCFCLVAFFATLALRTPAAAQEAEVESGSEESAPAAESAQAKVDIEAPQQEEDSDEQAATAKQQAKPWEAEGDPNSSGPDIYHLPDTNRNLRKVLGFRYEDFLKLWQQKDQAQKTSPPKYLLDSIRISGSANDTHADLQIELDILPRVDDWIDVPLELPALIVQEWKIDRQTDEEFLVFDAKRDSYVLWLRSEANKLRTLRLRGLSKLKLAPSNPGLELKLPHAASSNFVLQVPIADARFEVSPGIEIKTAAGKNGGTEVQLTGQAQPLRLQWKSSEQQEQSGNTAIKAVGQLEVLIDQRRASYEVELKINSYGDPLERLRVRLPVGAILTGENLHEKFQVVKQTLDPLHGNIIEIELPESDNQEWSLQLSAEQPRDTTELASKEDATYQITGFEVLDAFRQSGTLALHVNERLQAYFDLNDDIEQTTTPESSQPALTGTRSSSFSYSRFPWTLKVHTLDRQLRVSVKPKYEMQLEHVNDKYCDAKLELQFEYQFAGANTFAVRIDMRGWELTDDAIKSDGISQEKIYEKPGGLLVLPLENPHSELLRLSMSVRRSVPLGSSTIPLPAAQEAFDPTVPSRAGNLSVFVLPGDLRVTTDRSLQVTPTIVATEGVRIATDLGDAQDVLLAEEDNLDQEALVLRTFRPRPVLSAEIKRREQQIEVEVKTQVEINQETVHVLQQLKYEVKYRPTSQLLLQIPESLGDNDTFKVRLEKEELPFSISNENPAIDDSPTSEPPLEATQLLLISLPLPRQNSFQLDLSYDVPCPELAIGATSPLELPLISPNDQVQGNLAEIFPGDSLRATLNQTADEGPWSAKTENGTAEIDISSIQIKGSGKPSSIPLLLQLESKDEIELPTLKKAWLQTWIVGKQQQIRAVFRFRTSQQTVIAQLPIGVPSTDIEILLDGLPREFKLSKSNRVSVSVPTTVKAEKHTLELRYQLEAKLASWSILPVSLPRLECRPNIGHISWQLVLPRGWHVANTPSQLAADYKIGWNNSRWGRQPTLSQPQLEDLTGATTAPKPPASSNQYLYSGFKFPSEVNILVVSQLWLTITCILAAFGMGMLLFTTSIAKHLSFWGMLALGLTAGAFSYPEFSILAVQAIFWGGAMTFATLLLQKAFASPLRPGYILAPAAASAASTAVTESWIHGQPAMRFDEESETTAIQASRRVP